MRSPPDTPPSPASAIDRRSPTPSIDRTGSATSLLGRWLTTLAGCLGLTFGSGMTMAQQPSIAQAPDYRSSQDAPATWRSFALTVQVALSDRLAVDDEATQKIRRLLEGGAAQPGRSPSVVVRVWVSPEGGVERVAFDGLDEDLTAVLRDVLTRERIGSAPPTDMLQPLRLRLTLAH